MKLTRIKIDSFMGARSIELLPTEGVVLLCGENGAGKSSVIEATKAALVGTIDRVKLKRDYGQIVTEGQRIGTVIVDHTHGRSGFTLPNGKHENEGPPLPEILPYLLDAERFTREDGDARRSVLYKALDIDLAPKAVATRLMSEFGADPNKVATIQGLLTRGFDAAEKAAREKASEARGGWKAVTGETYGTVKAEAWAPEPIEPVKDEELSVAKEACDAAGVRSAEASENVGKLIAAQNAYERAAKRMTELDERSGMLDRARDKLARDKEELRVWTEKLAALPPPAGVTPVTHACPECGSVLALIGGKLQHYKHDAGSDPTIEIKRVEQKKAVDLFAHSVAAGEKNILIFEREKVELADLKAVPVVTEEQVLTAKSDVAKRQAEHREAAAAYAALKERAAEHAAAGTKAQKAKDLHSDVIGWLLLADALAPDGLPGRILSCALDPFNGAMAEVCDAAGWPTTQIDADMQITSGGRPWALLSRGEKWRADAVATLGLAMITGVKFAALDGADVLVPSGRVSLLMALSELIGTGKLDQVIVGMALKACPVKLPEHCEAHWIVGGRLAQEMKEAA